VTVERLATDFGAVDFNKALTLTLPRAHARPTPATSFDVYKQINVHTTYNGYISDKSLLKLSHAPAAFAQYPQHWGMDVNAPRQHISTPS